MFFILNTSVDPHFCTLFNENNTPIDHREWTDRKKDGAEVFAFLQTHNIAHQEIAFFGGVSGPGGFSSLRAAGAILNALAQAKSLPLHQVRADTWIAHFLETNGHGGTPFLLNSFGDGVFLVEKPNASASLERTDVGTAAQKLSSSHAPFTSLLPDPKRQHFATSLTFNPKISLSHALLEVLKNQSPTDHFAPDYELPAV